jgi:hypothetical protein
MTDPQPAATTDATSVGMLVRAKPSAGKTATDKINADTIIADKINADKIAADTVATGFRRIAEAEFAAESPLYDRLARAVAGRPDLFEPLFAAPPTQRRALLYFAAVGFVLRTADPGHPLAAWYATLGGTRAATDGDPVAALADFVGTHRADIAALCARKITQTNEVNRAALLRPAWGRAAQIATAMRRPELAIIELGASAGLLLGTDRYAIRYHQGESERTYGEGSLMIDCDIRGDGWPDHAATAVPVASRTGVDLDPIRPGDADGAHWLHACVWPEHTERDTRLDLALAVVADLAPTLVMADMRSGLRAALADVPDGVTPCVLTSHAIVYLDAHGRGELVRSVAAIGAERDMIVVMNEPSALHSWTDPIPRPDAGVTTHITVVAWRNGTATVEVLAEGDPHGRWLRYEPRGYAFAPPALSGASDV